MARNRSSSYRSRHKRRRRWVYAILALLVIVAVKVRTRSFGPLFTFGRNEAEFTLPVSDSEIDSGSILSRLKLIPESNPEEIAEAASESVAESAKDSIAAPTGLKPVPEWNLPEKPDAAFEYAPESAALIAEIMSYIDAKPPQIIEARDKLNGMLSMPMSEKQSVFVKRQLSNLAEKWLFSKTVLPQDVLCSNYKVRPGDQLGAIGRKLKVPYEIIMRINNIKTPKALRAGETIKVINGPFHVLIHRSTFTMDLYLQNTFVRSFRVGLGQPGRETPKGLWRVKPGGKLISPIWTDPDTGKTYQARDPDYPLGSRWIGLEGLKGAAEGRSGFAVHGTKKAEQIAKADSRGCIRMHDKDVILVYDLLMPQVSQVVVVE